VTTTFIDASGQSHPQISSDPVAVLRLGLRLELGTPLVNEVNRWLAGKLGRRNGRRSRPTGPRSVVPRLQQRGDRRVRRPGTHAASRADSSLALTASISASAPRPDDHAALVPLRESRSLPITFRLASRDCRQHGCARSHRWRSDEPPVESFPPTGWRPSPTSFSPTAWAQDSSSTGHPLITVNQRVSVLPPADHAPPVTGGDIARGRIHRLSRLPATPSRPAKTSAASSNSTTIPTLTSSPRPRRCVLRSQAIPPSRDSAPPSPGRQRRRPGPGSAACAAAAA
jgi:hypothetical protein